MIMKQPSSPFPPEQTELEDGQNKLGETKDVQSDKNKDVQSDVQQDVKPKIKPLPSDGLGLSTGSLPITRSVTTLSYPPKLRIFSVNENKKRNHL